MTNLNQKRIRDRVAIDPASDCWLWTGYINQYGQPAISIGRRSMGAWRVSFEAFIGDILDPMIVATSSCGNKKCVNPEHIKLMRRGQKPIEKTHCKKGHEYSVVGFYTNKKGGRAACKKCVEEKEEKRRQKLNPNRRIMKGIAPTHCKHGHEWTPSNTHINKKGSRICRACMREDSKRRLDAKNPNRKRRRSAK